MLVIVDYVFKCKEAIDSPTSDARVVSKLFKRAIFTRFGVLTSLVMVVFILFSENLKLSSLSIGCIIRRD